MAPTAVENGSTYAGIWPGDIIKSLHNIEASLNNNENLFFAIRGNQVTYGFCSVENGFRSTIIVDVTSNGTVKLSIHSEVATSHGATFILSARKEDWERLLCTATPIPPFQSYWGVVRYLGDHPDVGVEGDIAAYCQYSLIWRLTLEGIKNYLISPKTNFPRSVMNIGESEESILGRYLWLDTPGWGRSRIFYETAGSGPQVLLLLHTAGADSRQYHGLMDLPALRNRCTMVAFDLPGHGRSSPGTGQPIRGHTTTEDRYLETIRLFLQALQLQDVIVCGASMAGHVCLALAVASPVLQMIKGVVPCEASAHLVDRRPAHERTPPSLGNESIVTPERTNGMVAPTTAEERRKDIWWTYSSQATGIFNGDLDFYFGGWDGRGRVEQIDTKKCPVYMLTGEYDYSCTPAASRETATMIKGAVFEEMKGMGHFPASEDPDQFLIYLSRALDHIQNSK